MRRGIVVCSIGLALVLLLSACTDFLPTPTPIETATVAPTTQVSTATPTVPPTQAPTSTPIATPTPTPKKDGHVIEQFPIIYQNPELPTGCEITALTMILHYYGFNVPKTTMASDYLPTINNWRTYYDKDGVRHGPDLYHFFLGDPYSEKGVICGAGAIETAANQYFMDELAPYTAVDITGTEVTDLYGYVEKNIPVFVCITIGMRDRGELRGSWITDEGTTVNWTGRDHGGVLIGYTETTVTIADPIAGKVTYQRAQFESVYEQRGRQAVVLKDNL